MPSYKTLLHALILLLILTQSATAEEGANKFTILVAPSLQHENMDFWSHTPPESAPFIHTIDSVTPDQPFQLLVFAAGYALNERGNADITYDMQVYDPAGKPTEDHLTDMELFKGKANPAAPLLLSRQFAKTVFTDKYPLGSYTVKVTAHDRIADKSVAVSKTLTLEPFTMPERFKSEKAIGEWVMSYYQSPEPAKAIPAMLGVVQTDKKWLRRNLNVLSFFRIVLHDNPYLVTRIAENRDQFSTEEMKRILTVLAIMDEKETEPVTKLIDGKLRDFYYQARGIQIPSTDGGITTGTQLDLLWSEFLATGAYKPIKKIVGSLALKKYSGTLKKIKAGELDKNDPEVRRKAYLDATYGSAVWSLISNCKQLDLVYNYCIYIYQHETLDDGIKKQLYTILKVAHKKRKKQQDDNDEA